MDIRSRYKNIIHSPPCVKLYGLVNFLNNIHTIALFESYVTQRTPTHSFRIFHHFLNILYLYLHSFTISQSFFFFAHKFIQKVYNSLFTFPSFGVSVFKISCGMTKSGGVMAAVDAVSISRIFCGSLAG
jgi:hypothetical protein